MVYWITNREMYLETMMKQHHASFRIIFLKRQKISSFGDGMEEKKPVILSVMMLSEYNYAGNPVDITSKLKLS